MPLPVPTYVSGDFTAAQKVGKAEFSPPFSGVNTDYLLTQDFMISLASFTPLALNTAHPDYASYFLVQEGPLKDVGGGMVRWTRTYAYTPSPRDDYTSISYNFIGFYGFLTTASFVPGPTAIIGRQRQTLNVTCRVHYDYFLYVDSSTIKDSTGANIFTGTPGTATPESIPIILEQRYYFPRGTISSTLGGFVPTYAPGSINDVLTGTPTDNIWDAASWSGLVPTIPSRTAYDGWVLAGTELVAEASVVSRWYGNIYQRCTKYVVAR